MNQAEKAKAYKETYELLGPMKLRLVEYQPYRAQNQTDDSDHGPD